MRIRTEARARMYARIEALKKNAEFEPLLARLDKQVAIEAAKNGKNGLVDRWELISTIIKASLRYDGVRYSAGEVSPTFHELALLVRAIVEKLKDDATATTCSSRSARLPWTIGRSRPTSMLTFPTPRASGSAKRRKQASEPRRDTTPCCIV
jgi:hypothetical protein